MNYSASYLVTVSLQETSVKQYFWSVLLPVSRRIRIAVILPLLFGLAFFIAEGQQRVVILSSTGAVFLCLVLLWGKSYLHMLNQARKGLLLMDDPKVTIHMDEEKIEYVSCTGTRRHGWEKIDRVEETEDFIILMSGKLPLMSLPRDALTEEVIEFFRQNVARPPEEVE